MPTSGPPSQGLIEGMGHVCCPAAGVSNIRVANIDICDPARVHKWADLRLPYGRSARLRANVVPSDLLFKKLVLQMLLVVVHVARLRLLYRIACWSCNAMQPTTYRHPLAQPIRVPSIKQRSNDYGFRRRSPRRGYLAITNSYGLDVGAFQAA